MAWVDIPENDYKAMFTCRANIDAKDEVYVTLQYDDSTLTPTSADIRFKLSNRSNKNYWDTFYLILDKSEAGTLLHIKRWWTGPLIGVQSYNNWPYHSESITVTKAASEQNFTIPSYYFVNNGFHATGIIAAIKYAYAVATNYRKNYTCEINSQQVSICPELTTVGSISEGTIEIVDNFRNHFTVNSTPGTDGVNNPITETRMYYSYNKNTGYEELTNSTQVVNLKLPADPVDFVTVYAQIVSRDSYETSITKVVNKPITCYYPPSGGGDPTLELNAKGKVTLAGHWKFSWVGAKAGNNNSPVKGYRIRLYRNEQPVTGLSISMEEGISKILLIHNSDSSEDYYDIDMPANFNQVSIDPASFGFSVGDTVQLSICAYTRYGEKNTGGQLFNNKVKEKISKAYTVDRDSTISVKVNGAWKAGTVYVKVKGSWKEAESVSTKVNGVWKESI